MRDLPLTSLATLQQLVHESLQTIVLHSTVESGYFHACQCSSSKRVVTMWLLRSAEARLKTDTVTYLAPTLDYTEIHIPMRSSDFCPQTQTPCQMRISYHVQTSQGCEEAMHRCMSPKAGGHEYPISTLGKHKENAEKTSKHINHGSVVTISPPLSQS